MAEAGILSPSAVRGERILVVGPAWVGDMVMAQSLFMVLRRRDPEAVIDVIGPKWSTPILERMPEVREALTLDVGHGDVELAARWRLGRSLKGRYDRAIVLPRSWKSALVPFAAGVPHRTGFVGEQRYVLLNDRRQRNRTVLDQTVKRFVALGVPVEESAPLAQVPHPHLTLDAANQRRLREAYSLTRPLIGLMPGAEYGPAKQWPLTYFRRVAQQMVARGHQVIVLGGEKDRPAGDTISDALEGVVNLCGRTSLADAVDLLGSCEQVVTNDSGLMHVAAAVGTRLQAIYGSSSPRYTPPLTAHADIHWLELSCSPCFERTCPLGHTNCLNQLDPGRIIAHLAPET
ncbi:heptosyltransferase-2 [Kushneria sinocarnis]|uniref:lipopolysaccharide heptosyltransferase II n=1 Tax=Kushneria sinocarnis TaxID=595502 RepID=A0A420X0Q3_9GAMM|nr:lipopolysaccharide heptosyltransferase II [Kushneria sinocarnis]RKR07330.1 heptosyltransferase-2 [Kushneria sinocarnis]